MSAKVFFYACKVIINSPRSLTIFFAIIYNL